MKKKAPAQTGGSQAISAPSPSRGAEIARQLNGDGVLDELAHRLIVQTKVAPAGAIGVAIWRHGRWYKGFGAAGTVSAKPATPRTIFDLASITKSFLAVTAARLQQNELISFQTPLGQLLPSVRDLPAGVTALEHLLSHRAGLLPHVDLYAPLSHQLPFARRKALELAAAAIRPDVAPPTGDASSTEAVYSDLGYILAGAAISLALRAPLDSVIADWVCRPLRLSIGSVRQHIERESSFSTLVAPTENVPWRGGILHGVVHDENAWALSGYGASGHAGLFGSAEALLDFGMFLLDTASGRRTDVLDRKSVSQLIHPRPGGSLRMGFDSKSDATSMAGALASDATFGHLGFTGTSLWCDPSQQVTTVILTNRVSPSRSNLAIRRARPRLADEMYEIATLDTSVLRPA